MPYISEDLVQCCSFVLRCTLHLTRVSDSAAGLTNGKGKDGHVEVDGVYQLYRSNLSKFFLKRDSPVPFGVFSRALVYPWPDAGFLMESLIEYAFGPTILKNRKLLAVQLLTALFRNSTALSAMGQPLLTKRLHSLLQSSQRVITLFHTHTKKEEKRSNLSWLFWSCRLSCSFSLLPLGGGLGWLCVKGVFWRSIDFCLVCLVCMGVGGEGL